MTKKFFKLALIGLAAGFCLSVQAAPASDSREEVAMTQCSKDNKGNPQKYRNNGGCQPSDNGNGCSVSSCPKNPKNQKRSAAQKVVQGG